MTTAPLKNKKFPPKGVLRTNLSTWIFFGLIFGVISGAISHSRIWANIDSDHLSPFMKDKLTAFATDQVIGYKLLSDIFLSLVKVIVAPLVFSLLLVGLTKTGSFGAMGRIGIKTLLYFTCATLIALTMGLLIVNIFHPGAALDVHAATGTIAAPAKFNVTEFVLHVFPKNIIDSMAHNDILPIIVFVLFFAAAISAIGQKAKIVVEFFDAISHIMLKVTSYVMYFAPLAVFGAVAAVIAVHGLGILGGYAKLIICFFSGLVIFIFGVLPAICYSFKIKYFTLLKLIREPMLIAFGTSSSEAAMPKTINALEKFGCPDRIIGFVLPLGYSFNLDGSIMYMTFATVSIAQAYGLNLSLTQQLTMMLMLLVTSKGLAGVPRASLVVIAGMLDTFHIPAEGLSLIIAIDWLLDMGRSATNVAGNAVATAVVSRWEEKQILNA
ncbi:MAG TPA: dicarboxylate/amino acid:cation symporter [Bacteroidia bacterium]|nr:dicarboxylate/amino acid:cation symporter [Bacteroidia bacterium]